MTKLMRCDDPGACMFDVSTGSGSIIIWSPDDPIPEDLDRKLFQSGYKSSRTGRDLGEVPGGRRAVDFNAMQRSMAAYAISGRPRGARRGTMSKLPGLSLSM
jgi:hypothetical protein